MNDVILTAFWRTVFFYIFLLVVIRIMGKREIGNLAPVDLAVTIMMAELAAIPIANGELPVVSGVLPIATIMFLQLVLSGLSLRSRRWRELINGRPNILVQGGKFVPQEMRKVRYTVDDVLEQLRRNGHAHVADVELAILETDGNLSVIPRSQFRPVQPRDLGIDTSYEGLPLPIIVDGEIDYRLLKECGLDLTWLNEQLALRGIKGPQEVFTAILDTKGDLFIQRKEDTKWYVKS